MTAFLVGANIKLPYIFWETRTDIEGDLAS